jgi:nucleotide-binding universal stress UspA family protein/enoyl-CoA hydratase/carnithine racemase
MRIQFQNILCATDFSDYSNRILPHALALAREFQARLYVCHVIELHSAALFGEVHFNSAEIQSANMELAHEQLQRLMAKENLAWEPLVTIGSAPDEIARLAHEKGIDLVISGTHGRSGLKRLILGSVTERLMRILPCPLLVVRSTDQGGFEGRSQPLRLKHILVGCDFSSDSVLAFEHAISLAQEFQAELHLLHVLEPSQRSSDFPAMAKGDEHRLEEVREHLESRLAAMVPAEARHWCAPKTAVQMGKPFEELIRYAASHEIDMIVLGIRGHGLIETLMVGSTTDRVVRQSPCPVLAVRPTQADIASASGLPDKEGRSVSALDLTRDLFKAEQHGKTAILRLEKDLLFQMANLSARDAFLDYLELVAGSNDIKALVICGSPEKTGKKEYLNFFETLLRTEMNTNRLHRLLNAFDRILLKVVNLNKTVVHVDSGQVIPMFLNFSLACDYRIVSEDTLFQNPCIELGLIPKGGGAFFLPRIVGLRKAYEILLSIEDLPASQALQLGIVDEVVAKEQLESAALKAAGCFCGYPANSVSGIKRLLNYSRNELGDYLEFENQVLINCVGSRQRENRIFKQRSTQG